MMGRDFRLFRLRVLALVLSSVPAQCVRSATQVEMILDSDAPADRAMSLRINVFDGSVPATELEARSAGVLGVFLSRTENGIGTLMLPGSVGISPKIQGDTGIVTAWLRATLPARGLAPAIELDRVVRFPFVRGERGTIRVHLTLRCADRAIECTTVPDDRCTVSVRCREQGATCGELGECVALDVPVMPPDSGTRFDGSTPQLDVRVVRADVAQDRADSSDARTDVATDRGTDAAAFDVPGVIAAPTLLAPVSLSTVTTQRPTLAARPGPGGDGVLFELCADRACTMVEGAVRGAMTAQAPLLRPGWHWFHAHTLVGANVVSTRSMQWQFFVPVASTPIDTSYRSALDLDGDGINELAIGAPQAAPGAGADTGAGTVQIKWGAPGAPIDGPTLRGRATGDRFGSSISSADVNCDGLADLIVGAPQSSMPMDAGVAPAGYVTIFYGTTTRLLFATPALTATIAGRNPNDQFGFSVAGLGDTNGDGCADLAVGAPFEDNAMSADNGSVSVFYGNRPYVPAVILRGDTNNDHFGWAVSTGGDFNGDRLGDLYVGAPGYDVGPAIDAGFARLYPGPIQSLVFTQLQGAVTNTQMGYAVTRAGDVNFDGYSELAVGSPTFSMGAGRVQLLTGNAARNMLPVFRTITGASGEAFGHSVAFGGPIIVAPFDSLVVGAPYALMGAGGTRTGRVYVFQGSANPANPWMSSLDRTADRPNSNTGFSVADIGDVNGDSRVDLLVGANRYDPMMDRYFGRAAIYFGDGTTVSTNPSMVYLGASVNDQLGYSAR
jgi:hypothetical protein